MMMCRVIDFIVGWTWKLLVFVFRFFVSMLLTALVYVGIVIVGSITLTIIFASMIEISVVEKYLAYLVGSILVAVWAGFRSYRVYKPMKLNAWYHSVGDAAYGGAMTLVFLSTIGSLSSEGVAFLEADDNPDFFVQAVGYISLAWAGVIVLLGIYTINRRPMETKLQSRVDSLQGEVDQLKRLLQIE